MAASRVASLRPSLTVVSFGLSVLTASIVILLFSIIPSQAAPSGLRSATSSLFSLFNIKDKSKFWSESVIRGDFDDLQSSLDPTRSGLHNYSRSGNLASYLRLQEVDSLYLPLPVNFIFIGFEGKGNYEFKLSPEELERWFMKIDHFFEHTRVPRIGDILEPFYRASFDKIQRHHLPLISHINYNFSVHAIHMSEKVTNVFERAIEVLSRRDDIIDSRADEDVLWQVDVNNMAALFTSLVDYLRLESAYNIFVLNPKKNAKRSQYGYRRGLSESEINLLKENRSLQSKILQQQQVLENPLDLGKTSSLSPLLANRKGPHFGWITVEEVDTLDWSKKCLEALNRVVKLNEGKENVDIIYEKVLQMLHGKMDDMMLHFKEALKSGELTLLHADCMSDTWISSDRWAFIDLTSGPFTWGPAVGGEGVRTEHSLPNVGKTIGAVAEISEDEAEGKLQDVIREKFSSFTNDHQAIDILLAEIDIYELFAFKHCKGRRVKLALCDELDERMHDLKVELEGYKKGENDDVQNQKALGALKRMENWNLFSETAEEFQSYTVARDSFLAHLGSTLWGSMRHVVAPSVADGVYHYYDKISFQLFFITQEKVRSISQIPVDIKTLTDGLSSLMAPSQKAMFSTQLLSLSEDSVLMMAFSVARRAAAVPLLLVNGTYKSTVRAYLDSSILQEQLQRLTEHGSLKGTHSNARSTLEVPIFWFIQNDPLLVDKYYPAKALKDMIIVVQSDSSSWESHLQCNGKSLLWDLRKPIKAGIAATAEHLAGLLPLHLVYSHAHETAIEDWAWAVGCNPMSATSHGWQISGFQSDAIARSYIITSLEESIQSVNTAVKLLLLERTNAEGYKVFKSHERLMVEKYNSIIGLWRRISNTLIELRYGDAVNLLSVLEEATKGYMEAVNNTITALHPVHCTKQRKVEIELDSTTIPVFLVVIAVLWFVLRPKKSKPKVN